MLKVTEKMISPRRALLAGQRVSRKYRLSQQRRKIRRREYKKLKAIVPAIANKGSIAKITVIEEAIKYIDELHVALAKRMHLLQGISPALLPLAAMQTLAPSFPLAMQSTLGHPAKISLNPAHISLNPAKVSLKDLLVLPKKPSNAADYTKHT